MKKNLSKIISISLIIIILATISIATYYKVYSNYKNKLFKSMTSKIEESALKCYREDVCKEEKIYLKELYDNDYLDEIINPKNNEYLDENSYIEITDNTTATLTIID